MRRVWLHDYIAVWTAKCLTPLSLYQMYKCKGVPVHTYESQVRNWMVLPRKDKETKKRDVILYIPLSKEQSSQ